MKNQYEVTEKLFLTWSAESMLKGVRLKFMIFGVCLQLLGKMDNNNLDASVGCLQSNN